MAEKGNADELITSMAGFMDWLRGKKKDPWKLFLEELNAAGTDCAKLGRLYHRWISRGALAAQAGQQRASQGMMMIRRRQRENKCPMD